MSLKIRKITFFLCLIFLCSNRFAYLMPETLGISVLNFENITVGLAAIFTVYYLFAYRHVRVKYEYGWLATIGIILALTSSLQGAFLYNGQEFLDGLSCQKYMLIGVMMYFPITKLIKLGKISIEDLEKVLAICAVLQIILYFIQYILGPSHIFLSCYYTTPRNDSRVTRIRLYGYTYSIIANLMFCMNRIVKSEAKKKDYLYVIVTLIFAIVINQGRQYIVSAAVIIFSAFIFANVKSYKKVVLLLLIVIIASNIYSLDFSQNLLSELSTTTVASSNTTAVRLRAQEFYLNILKDHPILGGGYADVSVYSAAIASGYTKKYFIADNGIVAFLFRYGYLGLIFLIPLVISLIFGGIKGRKNKDVIAFMQLATMIVGVINDATWFDGFGLMYVFIYLIYMEVAMYYHKTEAMDFL